MAYTAYTQPDTYMAAYSAVPLRIYSDSVLTAQNYQYNINIAYSGATATGSTAVGFNNFTYTQLNFDEAHSFNVGDSMLLDDSTGVYSDYYTVMSVPSTTAAVANFTLGQAMTGTSECYRVIKYKMSPDLESEAKLDFGNTLKDFVTQDLEDTSEIYRATNTRFDYNLLLGEEQLYVYSFEDNIFQSGNVGFVYSAGTQSYIDDTLPFQIGDTITIEQDIVQWDYDDNFFNSGELAFTGSTIHNFRTGQTVNITGQITQPAYNGYTSVREVIDDYSFSTWKTFTTSTPAEPGSAFGVPVPEYNVTATITDIVYSAGTGVIITTDVGFVTSTQPIGGTIVLADGALSTSINDLEITGLTVYNAHINRLDYGFGVDQFDKYVSQVRTSTENNISTILSGTTKRRIELDSKAWLLTHGDNLIGFPTSPRVTFYDSSDNILSQMKYDNTNSYDDYYFPVGINQLTGNTNYTLNSGSQLTAITSDISYYKVELERLASVASNPVWFELNTDCSRYDSYKLMWKDRYGSWISYPFKYISTKKTEVERKDYYKSEGTWNVNDNTFGYETYDRGQQAFFIRSRDKFTLNSGWVDEDENLLIKDLMESASVYVQLPDGTLLGANITNKDIQLKQKQSDYIWNYKFEIVTSTNENRY